MSVPDKGLSRLFLILGDFLICGLSFWAGKPLFNFIANHLGFATLSFEATKFLNINAFWFLPLYAILTDFALHLKRTWRTSIGLEWLKIAFVTGIYVVGLSFFFESFGFSLKKFCVFLFFVLLGAVGVGRFFIFRRLLIRAQQVNWFSLLPPFVLRFVKFTHKHRSSLTSYFREKPSAPFVLGFMILLVICQVLLSFRKELLAEKLAIVAYFALVVGVLIELAIMMIHKDNKD